MERVLIVFDFDGTLVNTSKWFREIAIPSYYRAKLPEELCTDEIKNEIIRFYGKSGEYDYGITVNRKKLSVEEQGKVISEILAYANELRKKEENYLKIEFFEGMLDLLKDVNTTYGEFCDFAVWKA